MFVNLNKRIVKVVFGQSKIINPNQENTKEQNEKIESGLSHTEILPTKKNKKNGGITDFFQKGIEQMKKELG